jgi:DNA polymerase
VIKSNKPALLKQIAADIIENNVCPDLAQTATQLVMGDGNEDATIVFIGEAPGKNEDRTGKPFVGAAGKFLDEMLTSIKLSREDIYITNIVKYRPPNNRDPLLAEKRAFWPYLLQQLAVIEPQIIITLGRHSMEAFLPDQLISQVHGKPYRQKLVLDVTKPLAEIIILPLYHPAAALYNGSLRSTLLADFATIPQLLKKS